VVRTSIASSTFSCTVNVSLIDAVPPE